MLDGEYIDPVRRDRGISIKRAKKDDFSNSRDRYKRGAWLAGAGAANLVEVTSEADAYSIEGALLNDEKRGWRAGVPGIHPPIV